MSKGVGQRMRIGGLVAVTIFVTALSTGCDNQPEATNGRKPAISVERGLTQADPDVIVKILEYTASADTNAMP